MCIWCPWRPEGGTGSPGVIDGSELLCGCQEPKPGPLQAQQLLLDPEHLPSPQQIFKMKLYFHPLLLY